MSPNHLRSLSVFLLSCVILLGSYVLAQAQAAAPPPIDYDLSKTWSFTASVIPAPTVNGAVFFHTYSADKKTFDVITPQGTAFQNFSPETIDGSLHVYNGKTDSGASLPVKSLKEAVTPESLLDGQSIGVSDATALADVTVASQTNGGAGKGGTATGTTHTSGSALVTAGKVAYTFGYANIAASSAMFGAGVKVTGKVAFKSAVYLNNQTDLAKSPVVAKDPVTVTVTDNSGKILYSHDYFDLSASAGPGVSIDWSDTGLSITSDKSISDATFMITGDPTDGSKSLLDLAISGGIVTESLVTGSAFAGLVLPALGTPGTFDVALSDDFSYDVDAGSFNVPTIETASFTDIGFVQAVPEPPTLYLLMTAVGFICVCRYCLAAGAVERNRKTA